MAEQIRYADVGCLKARTTYAEALAKLPRPEAHGHKFNSGMTIGLDPRYDQLGTVAGEEQSPAIWQQQHRAATDNENPLAFSHARQIGDILDAINNGRLISPHADVGKTQVSQ